jgi:hypothetical protein
MAGGLQVARAEGSSFEEHLQMLPKKNRTRLAAALLAKVRAPGGSTAGGFRDADARGEQVNGACDALPALLADESAGEKTASRELVGLATLARLVVVDLEGAVAWPDVHAASVRLHDDALLAAEAHPALQEAVATLCEAWWKVQPHPLTTAGAGGTMRPLWRFLLLTSSSVLTRHMSPRRGPASVAHLHL